MCIVMHPLWYAIQHQETHCVPCTLGLRVDYLWSRHRYPLLLSESCMWAALPRDYPLCGKTFSSHVHIPDCDPESHPSKLHPVVLCCSFSIPSFVHTTDCICIHCVFRHTGVSSFTGEVKIN